MIITCKPRIPFTWIVLATLPWVAVIFKDKMMAIGFVFSMRSFVENPAALTFLLALPGLIGWIVTTIVNIASDCVWTRVGRRKPFVLLSWVGTIISIGLMPFAPDFWSLLGCYLSFSAFNQFSAPVESLKMEIVPPAQRVVSAAVMAWISQVAVLVFWMVGIGRFDEVSTIFGGVFVGESLLYWSVSIGMIVMLMFLSFGIRETKPLMAGLSFGKRVSSAFRNLISLHLMGVYILVFSCAILGTGLGAMSTLLQVEQFGITNQEVGYNVMIGGLLNLLIIPLLGMLSKRVGRAAVYVGLIIAGMVVNVAMFIYYTNFLDNGRPTLLELVVFGEMMSIIGYLKLMSLTPLEYDFIRRDEMGTYSAGKGMINSLTGSLTAMLMGAFVTLYATWFLAPAGERVRVTLRDDAPAAEVQRVLEAASWQHPDGVANPRVHAQAWYANRANLDHGRGFEIRMEDEQADRLREASEAIERERKKAEVREKFLRAEAGIPAPAAPEKPETDAPGTTPAAEAGAIPAISRPPVFDLTRPADAADEIIESAQRMRSKASDAIAAEQQAKELLTTAKDEIQAELKRRAEAFRDQLKRVLDARLLADGDEILGVGFEPVVIIRRPLNGTPDGKHLEGMLDDVRAEVAGLVDLNASEDSGSGYVLEASVRPQQRSDAAIMDEIERAMMKSLSDANFDDAWQRPFLRLAPATALRAEALRLDLRLLETPIDRHPSPITRVANGIYSAFGGDLAPLEQRIIAVGRGVRRPEWVSHVRAEAIDGDEHAIRIIAVVGVAPVDAEKRFGKMETKIEDVPQERLKALFGERADAGIVLYRLAVQSAKEQRLTVARPVLLADTSKQQYDYLAGYMAIFVLQIVGLCITFVFLYLVRTGRLHRRGVEEAEATR